MELTTPLSSERREEIRIKRITLPDGYPLVARLQVTADTQTKPSRVNLYFACFVANMASFCVGNCYTWTSPTLPRLKLPNDTLHVGAGQASWLGSLLVLGAVFGPPLAGLLVTTAGRRRTLWMAVALVATGWLSLLSASRIEMMYAARFAAGVGVGMIFATVPMYVAEIADDDMRESLGSMLGIQLNCGFILPLSFGPFVSYSSLILICLVVPIIFLALFPILVPETPYFLLQKGRDSEALKSLIWLRKGVSEEEVKRELQSMKLSVSGLQTQAAPLLFTRAGRRALLLACGLLAGEQLSGVNAVVVYAETIFTSTGSSLPPELCPVALQMVFLVANFAASPLVRLWGVKRMLVYSAVGMSIFQGTLGLYFYLLHHKIDVTTLFWLPVASLMGYAISFSVGFGPLPWVVKAEVFAPDTKAIGSAMSTSLCWTVSFVVTKLFPHVNQTLGEHFSFWAFALFSASTFLFTLILLPDTRGMSFGQIQEALGRGTRGR